MNATTPDHGTPDVPALHPSSGTRPADEMVGQMADVSRALFSLQLVQSPREPVPHDILLTGPEEPQVQRAQSPAPEAFPGSIALTPAPMLTAEPVPPEAAPATALTAAPYSIAMPESIAMPSFEVPAAVAQDVAEDAPVVPVAVEAAPRSMLMLTEIGFLDD